MNTQESTRDAHLRTLKIMNDIEHNLAGYPSMVTVINVVVSIAAGLVAWLSGMPDPIAWAALGFILNFIPCIGALMMEAAGAFLAVPLLIMGLVAAGHLFPKDEPELPD